MANKLLAVWLVVSVSVNQVSSESSPALDYQLHQDVLNPELCRLQMTLLMGHKLKYEFLDASYRIPSGIKKGNVFDMGDYHQCLSINQEVASVPIRGKYCMAQVRHSLYRREPNTTASLQEVLMQKMTEIEFADMKFALKDTSLLKALTATAGLTPSLTLAVCIPRVCSLNVAFDFLQQAVGSGPSNATFKELYCRLPDDKPFTTLDYAALAIFAFIGFVIIISTAYDLTQVLYHKRESSAINPWYRSFSVYTNTQHLLTFKSSPDALQCVDGIRTISMLWVILGHSYLGALGGFVQNVLYVSEWMPTMSSLWINAAPMAVDSFFTLSGILVVYTTVTKFNRGRFIRLLPLFYLNRLLRMFPLLAVMVLAQASLLNHVADGPFWQAVAPTVETCRDWWWSALLHVQNYVNVEHMCLQHTWYLSVDTQLYLVSPLLLWWAWGSRRAACTALSLALFLSFVSSSAYSFYNNFTAAIVNFYRMDDAKDYSKMYYFNTLTRAPPFFVGMIYGYLLTVYRNKKIHISKMHVILLWLVSLGVLVMCVLLLNPLMQRQHSQLLANVFNAYMRGLWAVALGWVIFACHKGYGGPVNWLLSLRMWRLPARLSYAVYLVHSPLITVVSGTWLKTHHFLLGENFYRFCSDTSLSFLVAFVLCVCIDAPCSTLQRLLLGGGVKKMTDAEKPEEPADNKLAVMSDGAKTVP